MSSLRARLFIALAAVVTLAGLVSGLAVYWWAFGEAIELQDGLIVQVGSFLAERPVRPDLIPSGAVDPDARVLDRRTGRSAIDRCASSRVRAEGTPRWPPHTRSPGEDVACPRPNPTGRQPHGCRATGGSPRRNCARRRHSRGDVLRRAHPLPDGPDRAGHPTTAFARFRFSRINWTVTGTGRRPVFRTRIFRMSSDRSFWRLTALLDGSGTGSIASAGS